jgi:translocation and assembly module TamB
MDSTAVDSLADAARAAVNDSLLIFRDPELAGPVLAPSGPAMLPELDLDVVVTDDLRIIGYGADIKLIGGVHVARGYDKDNLPGLSFTGDVLAREGTLKVMNRVFVVERGNIKFTGVVPPNPNLDLMLESQVNAYLVRILISGRTAEPVVELTCEPDLSEEDIMAVLLFGQPMNDLDNDQRGRMQEENDPSQELQKNLAGLAMAFGARGLQDSMSDSFGVDVVQMGSDSEGGSTLMVGKFITPDIMLNYHQSLEKSGTYFMTLEYSLNRYFKVISIYGQGDEDSGAELKWSKRY